MEVGFVEVVSWRSGERQAGIGMQNEKENVKKKKIKYAKKSIKLKSYLFNRVIKLKKISISLA